MGKTAMKTLVLSNNQRFIDENELSDVGFPSLFKKVWRLSAG